MGTRRRRRPAWAATTLGATAGKSAPEQWTQRWERTGGRAARKVTWMGSPRLVAPVAVVALGRSAM
uniref:Uncharacterized protein n=1 Tax=Arundo donax TaxID=35708 RepID=A0A0A9DM69_ARUDO